MKIITKLLSRNLIFYIICTMFVASLAAQDRSDNLLPQATPIYRTNTSSGMSFLVWNANSSNFPNSESRGILTSYYLWNTDVRSDATHLNIDYQGGLGGDVVVDIYLETGNRDDHFLTLTPNHNHGCWSNGLSLANATLDRTITFSSDEKFVSIDISNWMSSHSENTIRVIFQAREANKQMIIWDTWIGPLVNDPVGIAPTLGNKPEEFVFKAYPNPFNPATTIEYNLEDMEFVTITVYSITGQLVRELISENQSQGQHNIVWNGTNDKGQVVESGLYIYQIKAGAYTVTGKLILTK